MAEQLDMFAVMEATAGKQGKPAARDGRGSAGKALDAPPQGRDGNIQSITLPDENSGCTESCEAFRCQVEAAHA